MSMGAITWACLMLTFHQAQVPEYHMNTRNIGLPPRNMGSNDGSSYVLLWSSEQGGDWQQCDTKHPGDTKPFSFHAPKDGRYWFLIQKVDRAGRATPANPARVKPTMAVVVDTVRPTVKATAERLPDGNVEVSWSVSDTAPDPHSVRVDYFTTANAADTWTPLLPSTGQPFPMQGKHTFNPGNAGRSGEVRIRVQAKDQAQNVGEGVATLPATGAPSANPAVGAAADTLQVGLPTVRSESSSGVNQLASRQTVRSPLEVSSPNPTLPPGNNLPPPGGNSPSITPPAELASPAVVGTGGIPLPTTAGPAAESTSSTLPKVQIVNKRQVRLDFTVAKIGPSGLGAADVYVTFDKGASWQKVPAEAPITLPPNADLYGAEPVRGSVTVQLSAEGRVYGFLVAAKSKAGLAPPPPNPGDPPGILVEMDTSAPQASLFKPAPDPHQANTLQLSWKAVDRNLGENPITLEWAEHKEGPWTVIGGGPLPNSGPYGWHLPERMPSRVYLRLTVRDAAGNEARAQTNTPELIDLSVPQTKMIGVVPSMSVAPARP